jgi:hypothetical protein
LSILSGFDRADVSATRVEGTAGLYIAAIVQFKDYTDLRRAATILRCLTYAECRR